MSSGRVPLRSPSSCVFSMGTGRGGRGKKQATTGSDGTHASVRRSPRAPVYTKRGGGRKAFPDGGHRTVADVPAGLALQPRHEPRSQGPLLGSPVREGTAGESTIATAVCLLWKTRRPGGSGPHGVPCSPRAALGGAGPGAIRSRLLGWLWLHCTLHVIKNILVKQVFFCSKLSMITRSHSYQEKGWLA